AICLGSSGSCSAAHLSRRVANIDLSAGNVERPPPESGCFGEAGDGMFRSGIGYRTRPGSMGGNRSIVDDAATLGPLMTHHSECLAGAEKNAGEIDGDHVVPDLEFEGIDIDWRCSGPGVVEQEVNSAVTLHGGLEQVLHASLIGDVCRNRIQLAGQPCTR